MNTIVNILKDFSDTSISSLGMILIAASMLVILTIVLFLGWKVNKPKFQSAEYFLLVLKSKYDRGELPKKEYEDIKSELKESLEKLKYYLDIYI